MAPKSPQLDLSTLEQIVQSTNIAKNMNEGLWVGDRKHRTIYINPAFEKLSGYSIKEALGKDINFFFEKNSQNKIKKHNKVRNMGKASQYEAKLISKKGKKIPLLISGTPLENGGTMGIFANLTKIKKLSHQEKIAEYVIRNSTSAIVILSKDRKIKMWNTGAKKIFGYEEAEVINKKIDIIIPKEETSRNKNLIEQVEKTQFIRNVETRRLSKNGKLIDVSISVTKVTDENKSFIGFLVIYHDITKEKSIDNELQKRFEAIQDAYKELGLQKRQADYLNDIVDLAISNAPLENLEKLIVSASVMLTKCDAVILRAYDKTHNVLKYKTGLGLKEKSLAKNQVRVPNSISEEAIQKKRAIIAHHIEQSRKHQSAKLIQFHNFKTLIIIPLYVDNNLLGTISLFATDPAKFRLIEKDFLERFGKQCSLALQVKSR